jgi:hypothetical protein
VAVQKKEPVQLSLFEPVQQGYEFKVIVTNKTAVAGKVARFHEGRGCQEKLYGELKGQAQMGLCPRAVWWLTKCTCSAASWPITSAGNCRCRWRSRPAVRPRSARSNGSLTHLLQLSSLAFSERRFWSGFAGYKRVRNSKM